MAGVGAMFWASSSERRLHKELSAWLRPFGETLLASPTQHEELALGMR